VGVGVGVGVGAGVNATLWVTGSGTEGGRRELERRGEEGVFVVGSKVLQVGLFRDVLLGFDWVLAYVSSVVVTRVDGTDILVLLRNVAFVPGNFHDFLFSHYT
jgi:hypothetical protein